MCTEFEQNRLMYNRLMASESGDVLFWPTLYIVPPPSRVLGTPNLGSRAQLYAFLYHCALPYIRPCWYTYIYRILMKIGALRRKKTEKMRKFSKFAAKNGILKTILTILAANFFKGSTTVKVLPFLGFNAPPPKPVRGGRVYHCAPPPP